MSTITAPEASWRATFPLSTATATRALPRRPTEAPRDGSSRTSPKSQAGLASGARAGAQAQTRGSSIIEGAAWHGIRVAHAVGQTDGVAEASRVAVTPSAATMPSPRRTIGHGSPAGGERVLCERVTTASLASPPRLRVALAPNAACVGGETAKAAAIRSPSIRVIRTPSRPALPTARASAGMARLGRRAPRTYEASAAITRVFTRPAPSTPTSIEVGVLRARLALPPRRRGKAPGRRPRAVAGEVGVLEAMPNAPSVPRVVGGTAPSRTVPQAVITGDYLISP